MLSFQNVDYRIAGNPLIEKSSFQISQNQHVGLIGRNGSGKSTLFNLILRNLHPDQGNIEFPKSWKILTVRQELPPGDLTPLEYLLSQDRERTNLFQELETTTDTNRLGDIYERLIQIDAYTAESRAAIVLKGLGFDDAAQLRPLQTFSGGYRMRVSLAATLFQEPDLLLLDEPTNHLDLETTRWLTEFLRTYPRAFLLISHDRDFINSTVNYIVHLKNRRTEKYTGNFDTFLTTYELQQSNIVAQNKKMEERRAHMMRFVNKYRASATRAKQAQSRLKAIEKITFISVDQDDPTVRFQFPQPNPLPPPILTYEKITLGYGENIVIKQISGSIQPSDRIALVGANGNGKTTFARFLAGDLPFIKGTEKRSNKLKIGFYRQDQFENLGKSQTPFSLIKDTLFHESEMNIRNHLGRFGFSKEKSEQKICHLSGGERARLLFASLTAEKPNFLILDEPTNHLDMEMRESLIRSLNDYEGAVILITHDRHFLNHVADQIWVVKDKNVQLFDGDVKTYEKMIS